MSSNSATVQGGSSAGNQPGPGHFQQPNSAHHCKECGLFFDSAKSLEVHLQYHKENLLNKWAAQAHQTAPPDQETNNNNPAANKQQPVKREFSMSSGGGGGTIAAPADSSDSMLVKSSNKSPDSYNSRTTPETSSTSFGHPPTPQSYHSAPSPYQSHAEGNTNFSPSYQGQQAQGQYQPVAVKSERGSPSLAGPYGGGGYLPQHMYGTEQQQAQQQQQQYFNMEQQQQAQLGYPQDYPVHKIPSSQAGSSFRYHPYGHHPSAYERSPQVSSSSPAYPSHNSQPTPSPSPKQCDKCGFVCESAAQLIDHLNHAHPPTPSPAAAAQHHLPPYQQQFTPFQEAKPTQPGDEEPQTEILDLDSHKVHHVFQTPEEEEEMKRNGELSAHGNPHSVTAMLGGWPGSLGPQDHRAMFHPGPEQKAPPPPPMFQHPGMHHNEYIVQPGVTTSSQESANNMMAPMSQYRPFEHLPPQPTPPVISSTQLSTGAGNGPPASVGPPKGANWKSNEARRPKTYNCSACNKWFTSSGHLKRHYNTTLHKNAVKSSGQPDPATLPISAHHHPGRVEDNTRGSRAPPGGMQPDQNNHSPDSADDLGGRGQEDMSPAGMYDRTGGMLQQPPSGPYDRQPPLNLGPGPPLHSPGMHAGSPGLQHTPSLTNLSSGSPPNGEAGPSASHHDHLSRGLLSISTVSQHQHNSSHSNSATGQPMEGSQCTNQAFSLYPASQPHHMNMGTPLHSPLQDTISSSTGFPVQQSQHNLTSLATSYPNGSAPHVTPVTATSNLQQASTSLTIIGDEYGPEGLYALVAQQQQPYEQAGDEQQPQPLPSFAQFQSAHHRYGILLAAPPAFQANVGGAGPPQDSIYHPHTLATALLQHQLPHQQGDASPYAAGEPLSPHHFQDITVLESAAHPFHQQTPSPTDNTLALTTLIKTEHKTDYEHGSPQITSTGSPPLGVGTGGGGGATTGNGLTEDGRAKVEHKCYDCKKVFNKACYLTQHNKTFHSGHRPFKCHRCGKRFASDSVYQEHLAKHAGDKPYKCELCPKQFNHKTDLRRHMCLHTGQKPYACDHCGKGFIRKDHMLKHTETHTRKSHQKSAQAQLHLQQQQQLQAAS